MPDFENKNIQPETGNPAAEQPVDPAPAAPRLTLEPDPVPPEIPMPPEASPAGADPFRMPEPPRAPEPPKQEPPQTGSAYQQTPPNYTAQQPQYTAPQYNAPPQYGTPNFGQAAGKTYYTVPPVGYVQKSRLAAGLLAILFGTFGVHNFYLGYKTRAIIQLVGTLAGGIITCGIAPIGIAIWALVEGILILSATSPDRMYDGNGVILKD